MVPMRNNQPGKDKAKAFSFPSLFSEDTNYKRIETNKYEYNWWQKKETLKN